MKKKTVALLMACVMALGVAVGGTMAWLTDKSSDVVNTFTVGDINIDLKEHDYKPDTKTLDTTKEVTSESDYRFVPGDTLPKDPFVTVEKDSEPCWLFVKVTEANNTDLDSTDAVDKIIVWDVIDTDADVTATEGATKWTKVDGVDNVWYIKIDSKTTADIKYPVLTENQVAISTSVTKEMHDTINASEVDKQLKLSFTAYAIQSANLKDSSGNEADAADAWAIVSGSST